MQGMKERQEGIEHRSHGCQPGLDVLGCSMMEVFEIADDGHQRQGGFHKHTLIPGTFGTELAVLWNPMHTAKAPICQHNGATDEALDEGMKVLIVNVHRRPVPVHHLPLIIEYPAELDAHTPAPFVFPFFADLLMTAPSADGKEEFDRVAINHGEERGCCQQAAAPVLMCLQESLQPSAFGHSSEQGGIVAAQPAIEGTEVTAL